MSKKKKSEQPMELNDAALEATSGGTIMNRIASVDEDGYTVNYEWAATTRTGEMRKGLTVEQALAFNSGKGASKDIKAMKEDGWRIVKFE